MANPLEFLFGSSGQSGSTYNEGQLSFLDNMLEQLKGMKGGGDITQNQGYQQGQEWLNSLFSDPEFFRSIEAPAMRQFNEEIAPGIASRFASQGSGGSLGSTAFRNELGRAGTDLETNLAAMRTGLQSQGVNQQLQYSQQPIQNFMQMLQQALQPTQNMYQQPSSGLLGGIIPGLTSGFSQGYGQKWGQQMAGQSPSTF